MKVSNNLIIHADKEDTLESLKQRMFDVKELISRTVYGVFEGKFYICYSYYKSSDNIDLY